MKLFRLTLLLFGLVALSACSFSLAEDITPPPGSEVTEAPQSQAAEVSSPLYPMVPPNPANGAAIYAEKCAPCHGSSGQGDGPQAVDLPNPVAALGSPDVARMATPASWYHQVTKGNLQRFMPPFNSLSDRERWDVVAYSFSLGIPPETLSQGEALYAANCAGCHGEKGQGDGPQAASLAMPPTAFTDQARMSQKTTADFYAAITGGLPPAMPAFGSQLNEQDRWALADYLRMMPFSETGEPAAAAAASAEVTGAATEVGASPAAVTPAPGTTPQAVARETTGTVTGKVTNGSGGELPKDLEVTLHGFNDTQSVITGTTTIRPDGTFSFDNVKIQGDLSYLVAVQYGQATYGSQVATVEPGMNTVDLPVTVYDTTTDASILSGDRLHLFFEFLDEKTVRVIELYIVSNSGEKTLVAGGEGQPSISFNLPEGATNLEFQDGALGDRFVETPDGFGDTVPIRPGSGTYQVLFAFEMPYDRKLELAQPLSIPVNAVVILVPESNIKIKSDMLQDAGARDVQGTQYHTYNGGALAAGDELRLTLTGRPDSGPSMSTGSSSNLVIGLGTFGLALILAGAWLYIRTRSGRSEEPAEAAAEFANESPETVMDAILALDDLYQAGSLPEEAYRQRRAELKAKLKELTG